MVKMYCKLQKIYVRIYYNEKDIKFKEIYYNNSYIILTIVIK